MTPFDLTEWPCPSSGGAVRDEMALVFERKRAHRLLVLPAWFDEANKTRRLTVEVMRRLDLSGIDSFLPDLAGCNESEAPLEEQTLEAWRLSVQAAAAHFKVSHVWTVRAGALIAPEGIPGFSYAPVAGAKVLRALLRASSIAAREAGTPAPIETLQDRARREGIELAGWRIGRELFVDLESAEPREALSPISQDDIGGSGLWLRAEPGEDPEQADKLAALLVMGITDR